MIPLKTGVEILDTPDIEIVDTSHVLHLTTHLGMLRNARHLVREAAKEAVLRAMKPREMVHGDLFPEPFRRER